MGGPRTGMEPNTLSVYFKTLVITSALALHNSLPLDFKSTLFTPQQPLGDSMFWYANVINITLPHSFVVSQVINRLQEQVHVLIKCVFRDRCTCAMWVSDMRSLTSVLSDDYVYNFIWHRRRTKGRREMIMVRKNLLRLHRNCLLKQWHYYHMIAVTTTVVLVAL